MKIQIRRMVKKDIPQAVEIERICFSEPWTEADYNETLLLPYAAYYVAEAVPDTQAAGEQQDGGTEILGICGIRKVAGEGQISNVAVRPCCRGQHIARRLLLTMIEESREEGIEEFTLEVRAGNEPAKTLYAGLGFVTEGVRPNFYAKPTEDALIQWLRFDGRRK